MMAFTAILFLGQPATYADDYWQLDPTFQPVLESASDYAHGVQVTASPGGKVLVSSNYSINGILRKPLARLNADGSVDTSFTPPDSDRLVVLAVYPNSRVLALRSAGGVAGIVRLAANGSLDPGFYFPLPDPFTTGGGVQAYLLGAGRIVICGQFGAIGAPARIAVLEADGTPAASFSSPFGPNDHPDSVFPLADGRLLVAGSFSGLGPSSYLVRLAANGSVDSTFIPADALFASGNPTNVYPQPDGRLLVAISGTGLVRLNADGSRDASFTAQPVGANSPHGFTFGPQQNDGKIYYLSQDSNTPTTSLRRLNPDGTPDSVFVVATPLSAQYYYAVALPVIADDGTLFVGSALTADRYSRRFAVTRLLSNGSIDPNFNPRFSDAAGVVFVRQSDGKVVVAGQFDYANGVALGAGTRLVRLKADGALDSSFSASLGAGETIARLLFQPNGKIVAIGEFTAGNVTQTAARFTAGGARDAGFHLPDPAGAATLLQMDDAGYFYANVSDGQGGVRFQRYTPDGDPDATFTSAVAVVQAAPMADGTIVATKPVGNSHAFVRLLHDGSVDSGFTVTPPVPAGLIGLIAIPDGHVIAVGMVVRGYGSSLTFSRIAPDGRLDFQYEGAPGSSAQLPFLQPQILQVAGVVFDALLAAHVPATTAVRVDLKTNSYSTLTLDVTASGRAIARSSTTSFRRYLRTALASPSVDPRPFIMPGMTLPLQNTLWPGGGVSFAASGGGVLPLAYQWTKDGTPIPGATSSSYFKTAEPRDAGMYALTASNAYGSATTEPAIIGLRITGKLHGSGAEVDANVHHPNGKYYDQILLQGTAVSVTADPGQITRTSYIDLNGDIVQVEFSGAGTLSLVLAASSGPAAPVNYTQPRVEYMTGHASIVIADADETTNVSVFTVGRATAFDPTGAYDITKQISPTNDPAKNGSPLFQGHAATSYDGVADVRYIAILSRNGRFGGLRAANASFFSDTGRTGIYAPGVHFAGPVYVGNIDAHGTAAPVLMLGSASDTQITGGDLAQTNHAPVEVSGLTRLKFAAGMRSDGTLLLAQQNRARLEQEGEDVTDHIVVNPAP